MLEHSGMKTPFIVIIPEKVSYEIYSKRIATAKRLARKMFGKIIKDNGGSIVIIPKARFARILRQNQLEINCRKKRVTKNMKIFACMNGLYKINAG
jgi:hypothetical protein